MPYAAPTGPLRIAMTESRRLVAIASDGDDEVGVVRVDVDDDRVGVGRFLSCGAIRNRQSVTT